MKQPIKFNLEVLENFLCPNCKKEKKWWETPTCNNCGYDEGKEYG